MNPGRSLAPTSFVRLEPEWSRALLRVVDPHGPRFGAPLEAGENELRIAVSEGFGGWGVMLEVPAMEGLRVTP